jgi:hypothetical protein
MTSKNRKRDRSQLIARREEQDRAGWRAAVPFDREEMEELLNDVSRQERAADPFGNTRRWLADKGFAVEPVLAALRARAIASDWDLLMDADPYVLFGPTPRRLAWMPLERGQLEALIDHLEDLAQTGVGCDDTTRNAEAWLSGKQLPVRETLAALMRHGGGCDCEIVGNVDPEEIYPPRLAAVPEYPPPKAAKRPVKGAKPTEYRDEALVFPLPPKPWYWRTPPAAAKLALQFGKGFRKPELRILALPRPDDEVAWCKQRWRHVHLECWVPVRGETRQDFASDLEQQWSEKGYQLIGPESVGPFGGRLYTTRAKDRPRDMGWCLLGLPNGFRVVELVVGFGSWDPFFREARKLLEALTPA